MIRASFFALALCALTGCNPLMYVPQPIPSAPRATGVEVQGDLGLSFLSGQIRATGSPVEGLGLYASGHATGAGGDSDWGHNGIGGEVGVLGLGRFGEIGFVEGGLGIGSADVSAYDYGYYSDNRDNVEANVVHSSAHIGVGVERDLEPGYARTEYISVGFLLRGTYVNIRNVRSGVEGVGTSFQGEVQRFVEPAFRFRYDADAFAIEAQTGISMPLNTDEVRQYDAYPLFGGVGLTFRLDRLFGSRPPSRPAIPNAP